MWLDIWCLLPKLRPFYVTLIQWRRRHYITMQHAWAGGPRLQIYCHCSCKSCYFIILIYSAMVVRRDKVKICCRYASSSSISSMWMRSALFPVLCHVFICSASVLEEYLWPKPSTSGKETKLFSQGLLLLCLLPFSWFWPKFHLWKCAETHQNFNRSSRKKCVFIVFNSWPRPLKGVDRWIE